MGSVQTTRTVCDHPDLFSEVGIFSGFLRNVIEGNPDRDVVDRKPYEQAHLKAMDNPAFNSYFHTFLRCIGAVSYTHLDVYKRQILDGWTYEQMMDFASEQGFECVEVACWPEEKAERRYAGVSHIDAERVNQDDEYAAHIMAYAEKAGVEISALAYYPNVMTADKEKRNAAIEHLKNVIRASKKLGVGMVTTFIGRDQTKNVRENLELVKEIWPPIIKLAEVCDVKIAIENCPMLFGEEQWPGGQNLMTTPPIWREVFKILDSDNLGINYDPSHFIWQMIDYIRPLYEFKDKIFHVHYKDIKIYRDKLESCGIMAYPLEYMSPKIPGLGDVDWGKYVSALTDIGYDGCTCIEIEDKAFEDSKEKVEKSLILSKRYLEKYVI